jgi:predicted site-specific integrase-resolvase
MAEVGSGLDGSRLRRLLENPSARTIVVGHRERPVGFGVGFVGAALSARGRGVLGVDSREVGDGVMRDRTEGSGLLPGAP